MKCTGQCCNDELDYGLPRNKESRGREICREEETFPFLETHVVRSTSSCPVRRDYDARLNSLSYSQEDRRSDHHCRKTMTPFACRVQRFVGGPGLSPSWYNDTQDW